MGKMTLQELEEIRRAAKEANVLREDGPYRIKVTVHMGTCGIASGARKIMETFLTMMQERNLQGVHLVTSGCAGLCSHEPMATVEVAGKSPVKYVDLTPEKTVRIIDQHIVGGAAIPDFALAVGSERAF